MSPQNNFWNKQAARYDASISNHDARYEERIEQFSYLLKPTDVVLDFGCASGEIALDLAPSVKSIEGIDPANAMIDIATKKANDRNIQNASFLATDIFDLRLEPQTFDAILAMNVLHLVKDHDEVLYRLKSLLKPGGMLFVETPCLGEFTWWKQKVILAASALRLAPFIHVYKFGEPEAELMAHNFQILGAGNKPDQDCRACIAAQKPTE
ncbi:bifunctional 2-polyprenyl-6-hydroxyphenol methylase/3-demethylubiquinol 3-O-methyltransferase UbiG [Maritalea porphyrae]|jgi:2-polyprenyl-3-methyl-5-hydroxy-6-metoxy-1,4-benzoquinol methylase|uniref:class I SAM-dependent methyltransferase n=1 Tax=Maritalea porphyrae TaxID=880732 RepID=UPI0022AFFB1B|nr:class I SAM-dependent methyltransferase [Maritalea porphyrae]MCZ4273703.1 class I SAM-dependent methyltransferase [Maritalea porphyrae]